MARITEFAELWTSLPSTFPPAAHYAAVDAILKRSRKVDLTGSLVGLVYRHPVADNYAFYIVTQDHGGDDVVLAHLPVGDAYTLPAPHLRGLGRDDLIAEESRQRTIDALFAAKS